MTPSSLREPASAVWCPDDDTRHHVVARRNVLLALWAGRQMGLSDARLTAYAAEVHRADFEVPGDADVVGKVAADLSCHRLPVPSSVVRAGANGFHREALHQLHATD
jgi:hypothetical protein